MSLKRWAAAMMAAILMLLPGCAPGGQEEESSSVVTVPGLETFPFPDTQQSLIEAQQKNGDAKLWLTVPGTTINEVVMHTGNNEDYLRRNFNKGYALAGSLFLDYRSSVEPLSQNTIIYGHNLGSPLGMRDDPDGAKFAQLLKYLDEDFARQNPYIYLTTAEEQYVFQIFAVLYCEAYTKPVEYHHDSYSAGEFQQLIDDLRDRSEYDYAVEVEPSDKIITLSTCTYQFGTHSQNPDQRFIVVGRLVHEDETHSETVSLTANEDKKQPSF